MHTVDILACALDMPPLDKPPEPIPAGTVAHCAITGRPLDAGYPVWAVVPNSAGEFLDLLPGGTQGYLSDAAARCFKNTWCLGSRLLFEDGTAYHPLIDAKAAAKQERPHWSALLREAAANRMGQRYVAILTSDFKKRLWPAAQVGVVGPTGAFYVYDSARCIARNVILDWTRLSDMLDLVEAVYSAGYAKRVIESNLYSDLRTCEQVGWPQVVAWESDLARLRGSDTFIVSTIIAQKGN